MRGLRWSRRRGKSWNCGALCGFSAACQMYGFPSSQSESYKAGRIVALGANVREVGGDLSESAVRAASYAESGMVYFVNDATEHWPQQRLHAKY